MDENRADDSLSGNSTEATPNEATPAPEESRRPSARDLDVLSRQLGRPVRDVVEIPARCVCGNPLVAATSPRLSNGTPFPTTFYLTHPVITSAVSRLEAAGMMNEMNERLGADEALELGLADRKVPAGTALDAARAWAATISESPAMSLRMTKSAIDARARRNWAEGAEGDQFLLAKLLAEGGSTA